MSEPAPEKDQRTTADPESAAVNVNIAEPLATEPLKYVSSDDDKSFADPEKVETAVVERFPTRSTGFSTTVTEPAVLEDESIPAKRKWYKRLNPLKSSRQPPVPNKRTVSREYGASFFSLLTFQWMAPLMSVSLAYLTCTVSGLPFHILSVANGG